MIFGLQLLGENFVSSIYIQITKKLSSNCKPKVHMELTYFCLILFISFDNLKYDCLSTIVPKIFLFLIIIVIYILSYTT